MSKAHADRKDEHLELAMGMSSALEISSGFENYRFEHNALPEMNFSGIDTSVKFLGRKLNLPMIISSISGGNANGTKINKALAELANDFSIGFAVGSQRIAIDDRKHEKSFKIRRYAPNILIFANIGAVQLNYGYSIDECQRAIDMVDADALMLHLNPMQEIFQMEGNTDFSDLLRKIEKICRDLDAPVIVKEVGYGVSATVAKKLRDVGVYAVDVAGAGSISWADIEQRRSNDIVVQMASNSFLGWGNATTDCVRSVFEEAKPLKIIASGGVKNGVDVAKSIAMGADLCGSASCFLRKIMESRAECENFMESLTLELKAAMFCTGSQNIENLRDAKILKIK